MFSLACDPSHSKEPIEETRKVRVFIGGSEFQAIERDLRSSSYIVLMNRIELQAIERY